MSAYCMRYTTYNMHILFMNILQSFNSFLCYGHFVRYDFFNTLVKLETQAPSTTHSIEPY